jgi:hypothetical protein
MAPARTTHHGWRVISEFQTVIRVALPICRPATRGVVDVEQQQTRGPHVVESGRDSLSVLGTMWRNFVNWSTFSLQLVRRTCILGEMKNVVPLPVLCG